MQCSFHLCHCWTFSSSPSCGPFVWTVCGCSSLKWFAVYFHCFIHVFMLEPQMTRTHPRRHRLRRYLKFFTFHERNGKPNFLRNKILQQKKKNEIMWPQPASTLAKLNLQCVKCCWLLPAAITSSFIVFTVNDPQFDAIRCKTHKTFQAIVGLHSAVHDGQLQSAKHEKRESHLVGLGAISHREVRTFCCLSRSAIFRMK